MAQKVIKLKGHKENLSDGFEVITHNGRKYMYCTQSSSLKKLKENVKEWNIPDCLLAEVDNSYYLVYGRISKLSARKVQVVKTPLDVMKLTGSLRHYEYRGKKYNNVYDISDDHNLLNQNRRDFSITIGEARESIPHYLAYVERMAGRYNMKNKSYDDYLIVKCKNIDYVAYRPL